MTTLEHYAEQLAHPDQVILIDHEKVSVGVLVVVSENNSGGSYAMNAGHWQALENAGWRETETSWREGREWFVQAASYEDAKHSFQRATGFDPSMCVCDCCGQNFYFHEAGVEECFGINQTDTEGE